MKLLELVGNLPSELRQLPDIGGDSRRGRTLTKSTLEVRRSTRQLLRMDAREIHRGRTSRDVVREQLPLGCKRPALLGIAPERGPVHGPAVATGKCQHEQDACRGPDHLIL